jgi:glycosyltransferase involved in cell wall biosynthesis
MRVVLLQNMLYVPAHGGANTSNRLVMESMAEEGHTSEVVTPAVGPATALSSEDQFLDTLKARGISWEHPQPDRYVFTLNGVTVHAAVPTDGRNLMSGMYEALDDVVAPGTDWVLVSLDEASSAFLEAAHRVAPHRVVALAHTSTTLPFGPLSQVEDPSATQRLHDCAAVLANTNFMKDYLAQWGDVEASVCPMAPFEDTRHPDFSSFEEGYVTMLNPCDLKGIPIFLELADRFPDVDFAGVPTWGTTAADRAAMQNRPNVDVLDPVDDIDEVYAQTRILLMPSLWLETFGRCATEAMQRGLPVLASDHGGLPEAKGGVDYLLPVRPIEAMTDTVDDRRQPVPERVPDQDVDPWAEALERLLTDRAHYDDLSRRSREAAQQIASNYRPDVLGRFLENLSADADDSGSGGSSEASTADTLSDERRRLLALRALDSQE